MLLPLTPKVAGYLPLRWSITGQTLCLAQPHITLYCFQFHPKGTSGQLLDVPPSPLQLHYRRIALIFIPYQLAYHLVFWPQRSFANFVKVELLILKKSRCHASSLLYFLLQFFPYVLCISYLVKIISVMYNFEPIIFIKFTEEIYEHFLIVKR
jgi:hypothetical protein